MTMRGSYARSRCVGRIVRQFGRIRPGDSDSCNRIFTANVFVCSVYLCIYGVS